MPTAVEFFFDPACPWTWITSRWLATVAPERDLAITWRTWSLVINAEGTPLPDDLPAPIRERLAAARGFSQAALRVLEAAAAAQGNAAVGRLYTELGRRVHHAEGGYGDGVIAEALAAAGLAPDLAGAADDPALDIPIREHMAEIRSRVGGDVGVPIVSLGAGALSGPILSEVPPLARSLAIWDASSTLISDPAFAELKRHRPTGPNPPAIDGEGRAVA